MSNSILKFEGKHAIKSIVPTAYLDPKLKDSMQHFERVSAKISLRLP